MLQERFEVSERKACRTVGQSRAVQRYVPTVRADEDARTQPHLPLSLCGQLTLTECGQLPRAFHKMLQTIQ